MLRQLGPRRPAAYFSLREKERTQRSPACGPATSPSGRWPISASLEGPSQAHQTNSAPLEGSESTLRRVTHLRLARGLPSGPSTAQSHFRLARGQRTCPRAGGQSPPRSRTADLPSSGWPISASLEAISRHKRQMAPPPNRPPYEGIKSQPLHHGSKGRRRQTATPAVDVTGVPSTDPGHRSATPVAVAVLWAFNAARGKLAPPPLLFCRHPSPDPSPAGEGVQRCHVSCREGHSARTGATPDLPLVGSGTSTRSRTF